MPAMKAIPNSVMLFRLSGVLAVCLAAPLLLYLFVGPAVGALGAAGAGAFWYPQYRLPAPSGIRGAYFWFVTGGYVAIGVTLLVCLGRLLGVRVF
jgi:hypothetical protein